MPNKTGQNARPRIVVVGSINMDLVVRSARFPGSGETVIGHDVRELPGGKGANQAVAAARLDADVSMVGRVGDDLFGNRLRAGLEREGIDVRQVLQTSQCSSGVAIVAVDDNGENAITVIPGANDRLTVEDVRGANDLIRCADVLLVQLEVPMETVLAAISIARQSDTLVILDPAPALRSFPAELLVVDVVCPNETEATILTGVRIENLEDAERAAVALRELGSQHAIITLGHLGAMICGPTGKCLLVPSFPIAAVDTTAAGDAFAGALGVSLARGLALLDAVRFACAAGAVAASRVGAQPSMPTVADVERSLALVPGNPSQQGQSPRG